ncbi:MAG: hypothetical protein ACKOAD_03670 [Gammaproteobacteria bacterium]
MLIKPLVQTGNSKAIVLDKAILQAACLNDDALFAVTINPGGGITIQSVESTHQELKKKAFREVLKKNYQLLKRLSEQ